MTLGVLAHGGSAKNGAPGVSLNQRPTAYEAVALPLSYRGESPCRRAAPGGFIVAAPPAVRRRQARRDGWGERRIGCPGAEAGRGGAAPDCRASVSNPPQTGHSACHDDPSPAAARTDIARVGWCGDGAVEPFSRRPRPNHCARCLRAEAISRHSRRAGPGGGVASTKRQVPPCPHPQPGGERCVGDDDTDCPHQSGFWPARRWARRPAGGERRPRPDAASRTVAPAPDAPRVAPGALGARSGGASAARPRPAPRPPGRMGRRGRGPASPPERRSRRPCAIPPRRSAARLSSTRIAPRCRRARSFGTMWRPAASARVSRASSQRPAHEAAIPEHGLDRPGQKGPHPSRPLGEVERGRVVAHHASLQRNSPRRPSSAVSGPLQHRGLQPVRRRGVAAELGRLRRQRQGQRRLVEQRRGAVGGALGPPAAVAGSDRGEPAGERRIYTRPAVAAGVDAAQKFPGIRTQPRARPPRSRPASAAPRRWPRPQPARRTPTEVSISQPCQVMSTWPGWSATNTAAATTTAIRISAIGTRISGTRPRRHCRVAPPATW